VAFFRGHNLTTTSSRLNWPILKGQKMTKVLVNFPIAIYCPLFLYPSHIMFLCKLYILLFYANFVLSSLSKTLSFMQEIHNIKIGGTKLRCWMLEKANQQEFVLQFSRVNEARARIQFSLSTCMGEELLLRVSLINTFSKE
jgi:hypothetical protein